MARAYLDSNVVIRLVEGRSAARAALTALLGANAGPTPAYVVSDLVRMECSVKPIATANLGLLAAFERCFVSANTAVVALTASVCDRAARIRAYYGYSTPDALHLGAAVEAGCDMFVTADARLARFPDIPVLLVQP